MRATPSQRSPSNLNAKRGHALEQFRDEEDIEGWYNDAKNRVKGVAKQALRKVHRLKGSTALNSQIEKEFKHLMLAILYYNGLKTYLESLSTQDLIDNTFPDKVMNDENEKRASGHKHDTRQMTSEYLQNEISKAREQVVSFWEQLKNEPRFREANAGARLDYAFLESGMELKHGTRDGIIKFQEQLKQKLGMNNARR